MNDIMAELEFLTGEPIYEIVLIGVGIIGIFLGIDRTLESDEEESSVLRFIAPIASLILIVFLAAYINNHDEIIADGELPLSNYTILFSILFAISLLARPFRKLPLAFVIATVIGLALFYYVYDKQDQADSKLGDIEMKWLIVGILIIVIIIFIISFIQEQAMDLLLWVMGWGPYVTILSIIMIAQGITLILEEPEIDGVLGLLPG
jgi:FtsH-binding integral membrane protein